MILTHAGAYGDGTFVHRASEKSSSRKPKSKSAQVRGRGPAGSNPFLSCSILRYRLPLIVTVIMMSLFRSLVPVREMGKGKGGGHQGISCIPTAHMFLGQYI